MRANNLFNINIIDTYNDTYKLSYKRFEYPNLMELIINSIYEDIGDCLGIGLCGTCHVKIISGDINEDIEVNEKATLIKLNDSDQNSRLACQIILNEKINNMTFKIITDNKINL